MRCGECVFYILNAQMSYVSGTVRLSFCMCKCADRFTLSALREMKWNDKENIGKKVRAKEQHNCEICRCSKSRWMKCMKLHILHACEHAHAGYTYYGVRYKFNRNTQHSALTRVRLRILFIHSRQLNRVEYETVIPLYTSICLFLFCSWYFATF